MFEFDTIKWNVINTPTKRKRRSTDRWTKQELMDEIRLLQIEVTQLQENHAKLLKTLYEKVQPLEKRKPRFGWSRRG